MIAKTPFVRMSMVIAFAAASHLEPALASTQRIATAQPAGTTPSAMGK